jgi:hypothetical protein
VCRAIAQMTSRRWSFGVTGAKWISRARNSMRISQRLVRRSARVAARPLPASLPALALALSVTPVAGGQTADKSMTVFVTASEPAAQGKPTEADRQQASDAIKAAQTTRKDLDKA